MKHLFLKTIVLVVLFFIAKPVLGNVVINEALYNPSDSNTNKEYIILYNNGIESRPLNGYCLYAGGKHFTIPSFNLDSKQSIVIHWNTDGTNTSTDLYTGKNLDNMGNTSDVIALFSTHDKHDASTIIDYVRYHTVAKTETKTWEDKAVAAGIWTAGNFITNAQEGKAIKLQTDGLDNNLPSDWVEATPTIVQQESSAVTTETGTTEDTPEQISSASSTNGSPTADAGDNIMGFVNQEIGFDGTKSSDPESNELHYEWNMGNGKLIETPSFTYAYAFPGTYLVTLMVFDGKNYASDTITVKIQQAQITINEFLPNPTGKDEEEEWIEIYNGADSITDVSGWQIDDIASGSKPFIFPQNTLIAPKSYLVFSRQITKITLNNDKDSVRLLLSDGTVFQEINYEKPPQGKSSARTGDGFVWSEPTPGMANIIGLTVKSEKQTVVQQNSIIAQTVKDPPQNYVINLPDNEVQGGYINTSPNDPASPAGRQATMTNNDDLASIKQITQNPVNLALIIVAIVFGAGLLGLLLIKFRRRGSP